MRVDKTHKAWRIFKFCDSGTKYYGCFFPLIVESSLSQLFFLENSYSNLQYTVQIPHPPIFSHSLCTLSISPLEV